MSISSRQAGLSPEQFDAFVAVYKSWIEQFTTDERKDFLTALRDGSPRSVSWIQSSISDIMMRMCLQARTPVVVSDVPALTGLIATALTKHYADEIADLAVGEHSKTRRGFLSRLFHPRS